jgi:phosphatidylglycerol:prolipoprotein diacylglycerol transferase
MRPVLFYIPVVHLPIFSYGVMLGLSLIVGWYIVLGLCERDGMDREEMGRLYVATAIGSVTGSRVLYVLTNLDSFRDNVLNVFALWSGGLVAYGGFIGGLLTGIVYCRAKGIRLLAWADCVVPSLGTGLACTRIGCLLAGCDFGKPAEHLRWAVTFPQSSPAWTEQLQQHLIDKVALRSLPVHPTQIYEALIGLALFGLVMLVRRYRTFSGQMFIAFSVGYGILRYLVEELRADDQRGEIGPFSTSQFIGIVSSLLAIGLFVYLYRIYKKDPASIRYWEQPNGGRIAPATTAVAAPQQKAKRRRR